MKYIKIKNTEINFVEKLFVSNNLYYEFGGNDILGIRNNTFDKAISLCQSKGIHIMLIPQNEADLFSVNTLELNRNRLLLKGEN